MGIPTSEAGSPKLCCITARNAHRTQTLFILDGLPSAAISNQYGCKSQEIGALFRVFLKQTEDDPSLLRNCSLSLSKLKKGTLLANMFHEPELCILPECTSLHRRRRLQSCQMSLWAKAGPKQSSSSIFQSFHLKTGCCVFIDFFCFQEKPHTPSRNQDSRYLKVEKVWVGMVPPPFFSDPRLKLHQQTSAVVLCCFLRLQNHGPTKGSQVPRNGLELKVNEGCREVQKLGLGQSK